MGLFRSCSEQKPEFVFGSCASGVANFQRVLTFDRKAPPFPNYEEKVTLRNQISILGPQKRAADLLPQLSDIARKACMTAGKDHVGKNDGVQHILRISHERFEPGFIAAK